MSIILTGATGLVGSGTLHHILTLSNTSTPHISHLTLLTRNPQIPLLTHPHRPTTNTHTQISIIPHADFTSYSASELSTISASLSPDQTSPVAVLWALGMSQNDAPSAEHYTSVTKTYALVAAEAFAKHLAPRPVRFVYVSGEGATKDPGWATPLFGRVKGDTERELLALTRKDGLGNLTVVNVRPAGVDPRGQLAVEEIWNGRSVGWAMAAARGAVLPVLRMGWVGRDMLSPTVEIGRVLVGLGLGDGRRLGGKGVEDGGWTLRNVALRRLAAEMD